MAVGPNLVAINTGNSRTQVGLFVAGLLQKHRSFANTERAPVVEQVLEWWERIRRSAQASIVAASVNPEQVEHVASAIEDQLSVKVFVVGRDLPPPIRVALDPETITGIDRLLNAAAAFEKLRQACIIIDAGTAVTVDFVDGEGTFQGGAIAPGARMQLRALHEGTAALPELDLARPAARDLFGRSTAQAMLQGVYHGIQGMAWKLIEIYAERYGAYPTIIATGGDAELLFGEDELVDRIVPELTLLGIATAVRYALTAEPDADG